MLNVSSDTPKIKLALVPPGIAQTVLDGEVPFSSFTDLSQLSGILSDDDVCYYLWYNTKAVSFAEELAIDMVSILSQDTVKGWLDSNRTLYEKVAVECEGKYSIAGRTSSKVTAVDYGCGCFYTPTYDAGVLYLLGTAADPYNGSKHHYYDAVLAELSKTVKINDLSRYTVFDKYVGSEINSQPQSAVGL